GVDVRRATGSAREADGRDNVQEVRASRASDGVSGTPNDQWRRTRRDDHGSACTVHDAVLEEPWWGEPLARRVCAGGRRRSGTRRRAGVPPGPGGSVCLTL